MIKRNKITITLILIIIITYILLKTFITKSEYVLLEYTRNTSTNVITSIINESISKNIIKEELIQIEKNNNNEIIDLDFNNYEINNILYNFNNTLLSNIEDLNNKYETYYIPSGIINTNPILINLSPKIPFKIKVIGSTNNETYTSINDYGINNSIIEVGININIDLQIILPFKIENFNINKKIILDNKVIQGNIPEYYGNYLLNKD